MFADFAWPEFGVLGEFDGESKFTDPEMSGGDPLGRLRAQRRREARLRGLGWTVVRFEWADTFDPARVIRLLASAGVPRVHSDLGAGVAGSGRESYPPPRRRGSSRGDSVGRLDG